MDDGRTASPLDEAARAYVEKFRQAPPVPSYMSIEGMIELYRKAVERGTPVSDDELFTNPDVYY